MHAMKIFIYMSNYNIFCSQKKKKNAIFSVFTLTLKLLKKKKNRCIFFTSKRVIIIAARN